MFKVKEQSVGKVRLDTGKFPNTLLDENTPQDALEEFYQSEAGKHHIEKIDVIAPLPLPAAQ